MLKKAFCLTLAFGLIDSLKAMEGSPITFSADPVNNQLNTTDPMVLAKLDSIKADLEAIKITINAIATKMNEEAKQKALITQAIAQGKNPMEAVLGQPTANPGR